MVTPTVEFPADRDLKGRDRLEHILSLQNSVRFPAFRVLSSNEMQEFTAARVHMTDLEQWAIADAIHTREFIFRIAEAVWRIRSEWKMVFN